MNNNVGHDAESNNVKSDAKNNNGAVISKKISCWGRHQREIDAGAKPKTIEEIVAKFIVKELPRIKGEPNYAAINGLYGNAATLPTMLGVGDTWACHTHN